MGLTWENPALDPLAVLHLDNRLFMNGSYIEIELVFDVNFIRAIGFYDLEFFVTFFTK